MTTLKETVRRELLDNADDPARLEQVFAERSRSKGPFYLGLADATATLSQQFRLLAAASSETEDRKIELDDQVGALSEQQRELEERYLSQESLDKYARSAGRELT